MGTANGVDDADWDRVKELAAQLCDAAEGSVEQKVNLKRLFDHLDFLEDKYGSMPSILATRADFTEDYEVKERLLRRAYAVATAAGDRRNSLDVAHSIAAFYLEDLADVAQARDWLDRLDQHLLEMHDSDYAADAQEFRRKLQTLEIK